MKCSKRRFFTQADKTLMWDRWQKGESLNSIARLLGTSHSAISGVLKDQVRAPARVLRATVCNYGTKPQGLNSN